MRFAQRFSAVGALLLLLAMEVACGRAAGRDLLQTETLEGNLRPMECAERALTSLGTAWQVALLPTPSGRVAPPTLLQARPSCALSTGWMAQQQREGAWLASASAATLSLSLRVCPCPLQRCSTTRPRPLACLRCAPSGPFLPGTLLARDHAPISACPVLLLPLNSCSLF